MWQFIIDNIVKIIISLATVTPVIVAQVKQMRSARKENKLINDSLRENYAQLAEVREFWKNHDEETLFRRKLMSRIEKRTAQSINNFSLGSGFDMIMKKYSKLVEELAFLFYYSEDRKVEYEIQIILDVEVGLIETEIKSLIKRYIDESKFYKYSSGTEYRITFFQFFTDEKKPYLDSSEIKPFAALNSLKEALIKNGFDNEEGPDFIQTIDRHLLKIFTAFKNTVKQFRNIKEVSRDE